MGKHAAVGGMGRSGYDQFRAIQSAREKAVCTADVKIRPLTLDDRLENNKNT